MSGDKVKITLNGEEVEVEKGKTLLKAATEKGNDVPIFCQHDGLETSGYCRMCLVEVDTPRGKKLITSCNTPCNEGDVCNTHSEAAVKGRAAVLEFLLVNHPLDCPECDKAGECMLQDNTFDHGNASTRADFKDKLIKPRKELGSKIRLYPQRCIACRRCTQFLDQVSGTSELAFHQRGDHQDLDIFPGKGIENSLSKNIVDICPVGALIDKDFQYTTRQWMMTLTDTVCAGCSRGCAVESDSIDGEVKRFKARHDEEVNGWWMCDHGRDLATGLHDNRRDHALIRGARAPMKEAMERVTSLLSNDTRLIASAWNTNEELKVAKSLTGSVAGVISNPVAEDETFPGFKISGDKNPNRLGVKTELGVSDDAFDEASLISSLQDVSSVLVTNAIVNFEPSQNLIEALKKIENVILIEAFESALGEVAAIVLPSAAFTEKEGTFTNDQGLSRRLQFSVPAQGDARMDLEILNTIKKNKMRVGV